MNTAWASTSQGGIRIRDMGDLPHSQSSDQSIYLNTEIIPFSDPTATPSILPVPDEHTMHLMILFETLKWLLHERCPPAFSNTGGECGCLRMAKNKNLQDRLLDTFALIFFVVPAEVKINLGKFLDVLRVWSSEKYLTNYSVATEREVKESGLS